MHENANITCAIAETEMSFSIMLSMQPRTGGGGGASREDLIGGIAKDMEDRWVRYIILGNSSKHVITPIAFCSQFGCVHGCTECFVVGLA